MIFLTLLLNIALIFINVSADGHTNNTIPFISIDEPTYYRLSDNLLPENINSVNYNYRLTNDIIPTYYDIWINLSYTQYISIDGEVGIDLTILHPTRTIDFHAQRPYVNIRDYAFFFHSNNTNNTTRTSRTITNTTNNTACIALTHNLIMKSYNYASHILVLHFDKTLPRGNYTLKMRFKTTINNEKNFYRIISHLKTFSSTAKQDTRWPLFIAFVNVIGTRQIFPCWDEPNFKAVFRLALTHDIHYFSFSNTSIRPVQYALTKKNEIWSIFENTPKTPTYSLIHPIYLNKSITSNVNFMLNPVEYTYINDESKGTEFARNIASKLTQWISMWNKIEYDKFFEIIALTNWPKDNVMPKRGYVFYRKADITYNKETDDIEHKIKIASLVTREIIQLWLSNKINPSWWSSLWLNDGLAVLLEIKALNEILTNSRIKNLYTVQIRYESLHLDELIKPLTWNVTTPSEINSVVSHFRYVKGPAILQMLQYTISDDVFNKGLKLYFKTNENRSTTLNDFWTAMQTAYDESSNQRYKNFNVTHMMNAWINEARYPILKIDQLKSHIDNETVIFIVTISLDKPYVLREKYWWIPLSITTEQQNLKSICLDTYAIIDPISRPFHKIEIKGITLKTDKWILFDIQQAGYYRINYNTDNWEKLASFLKSKMYKKLHVLNRAKLIDDSFHLAIENRLSQYIFWNISSYLHQDTDYIAWYPMFKAIEYMSSIFAFSNDATIKIKENINNVLGGLLERIGYHNAYNDDDLTNRLRQETVKWACILDFHGCINAAQQQMKEYTSPRSISPWWRKIAFCYGVNANSKTWSNAIRMFKNYYYFNERKEAISILESLACIKNEGMIKSILQRKEVRVNIQIPHETIVIKKLVYVKVFSELQVMDHIKLFFAIVAKHAKYDKIMEYILYNFEKVKPRGTSLLVVLINLINYSYSKVQLNKIQKFVRRKVMMDNERYRNIKDKLNIRRIQIRRQEYYSGFYY